VSGCGCECNSGGFCGGCGHAGCGGRGVSPVPLTAASRPTSVRRRNVEDVCRKAGCPYRAWSNGFCGPHQRQLPPELQGAYH
jgi:hypothetical protein